MAERAILVLGAGGHGKAVVDLLLGLGEFSVAGVVDAAPRVTEILGVPVLGGVAEAARALAAGAAYAHPAIGANAARLAAGAWLEATGFALPTLIHPSAVVGRSATLGAGVVVMARAVIGPDAAIGRLALINTGAIVEHDCTVGEGAHLAPGVVLSGGVRVGARAMIGAGAVVLPGVSVGADAIIGAGAAVISDVAAGTTVVGVPARNVDPNATTT
ncbi:MAG: sugar O-acyltransferase, sialic acid O-acetyltransferase NeuD family [Rhodospirillales bacterium]|nr:sugar O-acyltransferase, sialic acid O-acetyltransferase NeuD family [Rhodospirillales bacterium]